MEVFELIFTFVFYHREILTNCHSIALSNVDFCDKIEFSAKLKHLEIEQIEGGRSFNSHTLRSIEKLETFHFVHNQSVQLGPIQNFLIEAA